VFDLYKTGNLSSESKRATLKSQAVFKYAFNSVKIMAKIQRSLPKTMPSRHSYSCVKNNMASTEKDNVVFIISKAMNTKLKLTM